MMDMTQNCVTTPALEICSHMRKLVNVYEIDGTLVYPVSDGVQLGNLVSIGVYAGDDVNVAAGRSSDPPPVDL